MAEQTPPLGAPDPARSYERAKPEAESGMGRLDNNQATPANDPDREDQAVKNRQPKRQVNAEEVTDQRQTRPLDQTTHPPGADHLPPPEQPDHSMLEEEPDGWDQAPTDIHDPRHKRHSRTEGKGGVE